MNKYHNRDSAPSKQTGGAVGSGKAAGGAPSASMPEKTANWPGVPGKTQAKSRAGGAPTRGHCGPFEVKKIGL
jgi:hypothetical protein